VTGDDIGSRGESMCFLQLSALWGRDVPVFRPRRFGEKHPTFDFLVEVFDRPEFFFFVQVKATTQGYTADPLRLKVQVPQGDVDRMVACPAPTYVVGMDVTGAALGVGFLRSVNEPRGHVASLPTTFRIDRGLLEQLRDEVVGYWTGRAAILRGSRFHE
jgi:hypothetical protein